MQRKIYLATLGLAAVMVSAANAAEWQLAEGMGSVQFSAVQQGTKFTGRFEKFAAKIDIDPAAIESGSIVGVVDTSTVNTRDHDRDATLADRDWFDTANHPEATFESASISKQDDGSYVAEGTLTLKGQTKPAQMKFTFDAAGATAKFAGTMTVDRFAFNVGEGWNDTSWVGQNVDVQVSLDLKK